MLIGGIEAGGTKMVCAVGDENGVIKDRTSFPTRQPEETFADMIAYYRNWDIQALGIGCFGPLDLNRQSRTYGYITKTPKPGWGNCDIVGAFKDALGVPVGFDTDVNGAVLGEVTWGAAKGLDSAIYITIGTGVGVGVYVNGGLLHGLVHPEGGHILLIRHPKDTYEGKCPFHKNCVEGLAAGPSIEARWGKKAAELADRDEVWEMEAYYIAQAITDYILSYSPQKIILWGGVMHQEKLFGMVRKEVLNLLNGYVAHEMITEHIDQYIVPPALGEDPGIMGAIKLGLDALG
ncbi:ROK family protein [uncultured Acetatifactor sp.]|uniref:ROK family protein n=1 Tax=uncultured Acetatifactor sp. TaxID=1671927 RepID=UPI002610A73A|nr:ROK family protein [uncultured Acetatifactor sp.]MCI9572965.1 ROK family protein [Lachnospiraceae bacterium]